MDTRGGASKLRAPKTASSERFLGVFTDSIPETAVGDELNEHDVFWTGNFSEAGRSHSSNSPSSSFNRNRYLSAKSFSRPENFGILAALPMTESDPTDIQSRSIFNHKASVSSSSSPSPVSSARLIPVIPKKPPLDRPSSVKYHQSAPVNVPLMSKAMQRNRAMRQFDEIDDNGDEADGEMLPPHEIVDSRQSPMVAFSVLEGAGRTLKGRDLRQVRNAVWRKTGFLD